MLNNLETGSLRVGSNQLLSTLVLPKYISEFMRAYPNIHLKLMDANSTALENAITNGILDVVIDNSLLPASVFTQRHLATEHLLLAVPASFRENSICSQYTLSYEDILAGKHTEYVKPVPLKKFAQTPFILMNRDNDIRKQANAIFQETNFNPKVLFELDRLTSLYTYVEQGIAATLVSDTLIKNIRGVAQENIVFYVLPAPYNQRNIYISYKRNKYFSNALSKLIDTLNGLK